MSIDLVQPPLKGRIFEQGSCQTEFPVRRIPPLLCEASSKILLFSLQKVFPPPFINQVLQSFNHLGWWSYFELYFFRAKIRTGSKLKLNVVFQVYPKKC